MVSAQIVVTLGKTPGYGKASNYSTRIGFFLMCSENCVANPVQVEASLVHLPKIHTLGLDLLPAINKHLLYLSKAFNKAFRAFCPPSFGRLSKAKTRTHSPSFPCQSRSAGR